MGARVRVKLLSYLIRTRFVSLPLSGAVLATVLRRRVVAAPRRVADAAAARPRAAAPVAPGAPVALAGGGQEAEFDALTASTPLREKNKL